MDNRHTPRPAYAAPSESGDGLESGGRFSADDERRIRKDLALQKFNWVPAFRAVATKLLEYQGKREALLNDLYQLPKVGGSLFYFERKKAGIKVPLNDICPFTVMGTFNLEPRIRNDSVLTKKRVAILEELCEYLGINPTIPTNFSGVPTLQQARPWYFERADLRKNGDIDALWKVFVDAAKLANGGTGETNEIEDDFASAYDRALEVSWTNWKLSIGLFWTNPKYFLTLEENSREFIRGEPLELYIPETRIWKGRKSVCKAEGYLDLMRKFRTSIERNEYPFKDFIELSRTARKETEAEE